MRTIRATDDLRSELRAQRKGGRDIAFVPTMGALHAGHLSLVEAARGTGDVVVLSIFVNPLQFGPNEDFERYPRDEERDLVLASDAGVDIVFLPAVAEIYPDGATTTISVGSLGQIVEGAARPGHFDGVATVVVKLFNIVQPDRAFFGQKDAQQVAVIKQVTRDLAIPTEIRVSPTIRESDGLALSSRNRYLESEERDSATVLYRALREGERALRDTGIEAAEKIMRELIESGGLRVEYALVVDPETFRQPRRDGDCLLTVAAILGRTRLIDNLLVEKRSLEE